MGTLTRRGIGIDPPPADTVEPPCEDVDDTDDGASDLQWVATEQAAVRYSHLALRFAAIHLRSQLDAAIALDREGRCDPALDNVMGYVTAAYSEVDDLVHAMSPKSRTK